MNPDTLFLEIANASLERILNALADSPIIRANSELASKVNNALAFCKESQRVSGVLIGRVVELEALETAHSMTFEDPAIITEKQLDEKIATYDEMRENGADENVIYLQAKKDGANDIQVLKILHAVFDLSLAEVQQIQSANERVKS